MMKLVFVDDEQMVIEVDCNDTKHFISYDRNGKCELLGHGNVDPVDLSSREYVLQQLGGQKLGCLEAAELLVKMSGFIKDMFYLDRRGQTKFSDILAST